MSTTTMRIALAATAGLGLVIGSTAPASAADATLSGADLAGAVAVKRDIKPWYSNVKVVDGPKAGTGADRIPEQGICFAANGNIKLLKDLPKRQAYSVSEMGQNKGLISLLVQYKSAKKSKNAFGTVKDKLDLCPGVVNADGATISQDDAKVPGMYEGKAVMTSMTSQGGSQDSGQLVVIRQVGKSLSFTRYSQLGVPSNQQADKATALIETVSALTAYRYDSLRQAVLL